MEYKVNIAGVDYDMSDLFSVTITQPLFEQFSVGNACSAELKMQFIPKSTITKMAKIIPYARENNTSSWMQLGVFYTDTRSMNGGILEITAYDEMLKAEVIWEPDQSLLFPMTMKEAVSEISRLMGISVDSRTSLSTTYSVDYPANDYTYRDVLRFIAAAHAGNWIITASGKLLLVPLFGSMPPETNYLVSEDGNAITFGGVRITIG